MKNLSEGGLKRVRIEDESDSYDDEDDLDLNNLSEEDLEDSEADQFSSEEEEEEEKNGTEPEEFDEEQALREDMAEIPFGALMQAQAQLKPSKSRMDATPSERSDGRLKVRDEDVRRKEETRAVKRKRDNKHAPMEMSSKRPVGRGREAVEVQKIERRDPRFDPDTVTKTPGPSGHTKHNYGFLEDYKKDEMRILKESIAKEKDPGAKAKLEKTLGSMQSRQQAAKERERRQRVLTEFKHKQRAAEKDGKTPYHLKAAEKNKLYLKDKFDSMKDSKGLDKFMEKKRKRRSQKDRKRALPT